MRDKKRSIPNVLILLAAYNGSLWIEDQINSILNQKNVKIKVLVSIDISDDDTLQTCQNICELNKNVEILNYEKKFGNAAKNFFRLINEAEFEDFDFIGLSDQDDIWLEEKISYSIEKIIYEKCNAFSSSILAWWPNHKTKMIKKSWKQKKYDYLFESAGPGCTYLFEKKPFQEFKNFLQMNWDDINEIEFHDWIIYAYFRVNNFKWYIDDLPLIKYRQHMNNYFGINIGFKAFKKRAKLIKNNWYRNEVIKIKNILNIKNDIDLKFRIKNFFHLRRRPRDVFAFLIFNILGLY